MKPIFTKNLVSASLFFLFLVFSPSLKGQTLEEIPNPPDFTLSWFSGGENGDLFFEYFDASYYTDLFHYDGMDLNQIPFGMNLNFAFYTNTYNDKFYFAGYDFNFNQLFFEYDGVDAIEIPLPAGFQFSNFEGEFNSKMYVSLFDLNFNNVLFEYDGTTLTEVPAPAGFTYGGFISVFNDIMYLTYYDANFNTTIMGFDGTNFTSIPVPTGIQYSFYVGETGSEMYLSFFEDFTYNNLLFTFDGTTLTEIQNPVGFQFSWVLLLDEDLSYFSYLDPNFNNTVFSWDGNVLNELVTPAGLQFPNFVNKFDGKDFFSFFDANFNQVLYNYDGTQFNIVDAGAGFTFSQFADTLNGKAYYIYFDNNFNGTLTELEAGSNSPEEVVGPAGFTFSNFGISFDQKLFLGYNNAFFNSSLFIFDGVEFTEVTNPAGKVYNFLMTEDEGFLYLKYDEVNNYVGTLYKLRPNSIPTSADNSVYTLINIPYFFSTDDFSFADTDGDDFASILITEVESIGNLFLDGAHVYEGDVISVNDLQKLVFFPNTGDEGLNYDLFKFKVGDGDDFSEFDYVMNINVVDEIILDQDNIFLNANILLYPVPVENFATLQVNAKQQIGSIHLRVISMNGQILLENNFENVGEEFQETINVSQLPAGQYIIHGTTPHGIIAKPFVK